MFLEYYGLREQPFGVTPDPRYLYFSETHREALGSLFYGIESGCGFLTLIAPPGLGKTTLLAQLLERLRNTAQTVFLFHTQCDSREFLSQLLLDLGVDCAGQNLAYMYEALHSVLLRNARTGRRFLLVIDEAQNLADSVLETIRLLSDFETSQAKLIQIVLCGQPQLADRLAHSDLIQLRQRISIVSRLQPLNSVETLMYIEHRLVVAGHCGPSPFSYEAVNRITTQSAGIPRNINNICFNALTLGYSKRQKQIDVSTVREVLADLDLEALRSSSKPTTDTTSDSLFSLGELEPTNEQSYNEFHAAVRAAWGTDVGNKMEVACSEDESQAVTAEGARNLGDASNARNISLPVVAESQPTQRSNIAAELAAMLDSVMAPSAVTPGQGMPIRPASAFNAVQSQNERNFTVGVSEVKPPYRSIAPLERELNAPHSEAEAPASAITADPVISVNAPIQNLEKLRDAVFATRGRSLEMPEQLGLTEVLTTYFGPSLNSRIVQPLPPMQDGTITPTLEA